MTSVLYFFQRYAFAFVMALILHIFVLSAVHITTGSAMFSPVQITIEPTPLRVQLIRLQPETVAPTPSPESVVPNESGDDDAAKPEEEPKETQAELLERLKQEREARLAELRNRAFSDSIGDELSAEMQDAVEDIAQVYITGIYLSVVENWSRPPSARNEMSAIVLVELFPSGELNTVAVIESSGDSAFDRSAENAVRRAAPFEVPDDLALFEASFRSFKLNFKPVDLLR